MISNNNNGKSKLINETVQFYDKANQWMMQVRIVCHKAKPINSIIGIFLLFSYRNWMDRFIVILVFLAIGKKIINKRYFNQSYNDIIRHVIQSVGVLHFIRRYLYDQTDPAGIENKKYLLPDNLSMKCLILAKCIYSITN